MILFVYIASNPPATVRLGPPVKPKTNKQMRTAICVKKYKSNPRVRFAGAHPESHSHETAINNNNSNNEKL